MNLHILQSNSSFHLQTNEHWIKQQFSCLPAATTPRICILPECAFVFARDKSDLAAIAHTHQ